MENESFKPEHLPQEGEPIKEKEPSLYFDAPSLIADFEKSEFYQPALAIRKEIIARNRPGLSEESITNFAMYAVRGKDEYIDALYEFYGSGHTIPIDAENFARLSEEIQSAMVEYWKYIKYMEGRLGVIRGMYQDDQDQLLSQSQTLDRQRDKRHVAAALALLGNGLPKIGGFDDEDWPSPDEIRIGRQLISLMTEERGLDAADPRRELKKLTREINNSQLTFE